MSRAYLTNVFKDCNYSPVTLRNRIGYLSLLNITEDNFKDVLSDMTCIKGNTIKSWACNVFHILSFLKNVEQDNKVLELIGLYAKMADQLKKIIYKQESNNIKDPSFVSIKDMQNILREKRSTIQFKTINDFSLVNYKRLEYFTMLSLYINTPALRNDYYNMVLVFNFNRINSDTTNYMVVSKRYCTIVLNSFKTKSSFGTVNLQVDNNSCSLIKTMLYVRNKMGLKSPYLFNKIGKNGLTPMLSPFTMSARIATASKAFLGFKKTINDFRHAWETHIQSQPEYQTMTIEERQREHSKLLHHINTAMVYNRV